MNLKNITFREVENYKHVKNEEGHFLVNDYITRYPNLNYLNLSFEDEFLDREIVFFLDSSNNLIYLQSDPFVLATTKNHEGFKKMHETIMFHPRYAKSLEDIQLSIIKGFTNGRTIDVLLPKPMQYEEELYSLLNFKGVGAHALKQLQVEQNSWFDIEKNKFVPFESVMDKSLGRRWGLIDTYEATREYKNNLFSDLGLPQAPHISLNEVPENIFPFKGTSQIVRGINTNVRFDDFLLGCVKRFQEYINEEKITSIDKKYFEVQRTLAKENKHLISVMGRIANNRYIDGTFTDMENYAIKIFESQEKLLKKATASFMCILSCGYLSLSFNDEKRENYLNLLENKTGIKFTKFKDKDPNIFLDRSLSKEEYKQYEGELPKMYHELKPMIQEYLFS